MSDTKEIKTDRPHVVIIGGGFGGLYAAKSLKNAPVKVTLIDRRNFHLFQPLLYQVATGGLSPGDVASPLRGILSKHKNTWVLEAEVVDLDPAQRRIILRDGELQYDVLVVATGASHHYFGHEEWVETAPGLKTIEDALDIRRRILLAFEAAEWEANPDQRRAWMRFVVVGGGPTGVELAGALAELAHGTLKDNFRNFNPAEVEILLVEGIDRVLPPYPADLSAKAKQSLERLGVTVWTNALVTNIRGETITIRQNNVEQQIQAQTILWAAGMKASRLGQVLAERAGAPLDRAGRVIVEPNLTIPGEPNIFVIGDLALFTHQGSKPLPGVAPVAMQEGSYVAEYIKKQLRGETNIPAFRYFNKGSLAVIGRNAGVADFGSIKFAGFLAWLIWLFVHIWYLIEFDNKLMVMFQWAWNYLTRNRGARLITGPKPVPLVETEPVEPKAANLSGVTTYNLSAAKDPFAR